MSLLEESWWWQDTLERPKSMGSPFEEGVRVGRAERGARSETDTEERVRGMFGLEEGSWGGEEEMSKPSEDVGIGVGYFILASSSADDGLRACLFAGGSFGGDEGKSNAGRRVGAGRLTPAAMLPPRPEGDDGAGVSIVVRDARPGSDATGFESKVMLDAVCGRVNAPFQTTSNRRE